MVKKTAEDDLPLLKDQIKAPDGKPVTQVNIESFSKLVVSKGDLGSEDYQSGDGQNRTVYSLTIPMVPNHIEIRADCFKDEVIKQAKRFNLDPRLIFAVIYTNHSSIQMRNRRYQQNCRQFTGNQLQRFDMALS